MKTGKAKRTWYFTEEKVSLYRRLQNVWDIPEERRNLRANVEATVKEMKRGVKNGKLRIRGKIRTSFYFSMTAIAVNLTRIHKYMANDNNGKADALSVDITQKQEKSFLLSNYDSNKLTKLISLNKYEIAA